MGDHADDARRLEPDTERCEDCGGEMVWCESCRMYTQICCVDYGTCMCS